MDVPAYAAARVPLAPLAQSSKPVLPVRPGCSSMDAVLRGAALAATLMQAGEARARPTDHEYYIPCTGKVVDSSALESMELCLLCGGSGQVWQNRTLAPKYLRSPGSPCSQASEFIFSARRLGR